MMKQSGIASHLFQRRLLQWFDQHGRKHLPWQQDKTAYRVWISEIMLQQTQVSTVIDYFQRFISRFPDIVTLANAKEDEVLHLWTGLGYYQRARHLHKTAKIIRDTYQGHFPDDLAALEALPGIGRSTAGAILSIAFGKSAAILDGNVKRVFTRLYGITSWPGEKDTHQRLWEIAEKYTPHTRVADYTQAIMDLGATVCVRGQPDCARCPFTRYCVGHAQGIAARLPQPKPRKALPVRAATLMVIYREPHYVLLEKRSLSGVWKGLWSLPELEGVYGKGGIRKACRERFGLQVEKVIVEDVFRHTFSHYHLDILPAFITLKKASSREQINSEQQIWYNLRHKQSVGMPAPVKALLNRL